MPERYNNVRVVQQEDKRWTLAWEDETGKTQERKDYPSAEEATIDRDQMLAYARQGEFEG